MPLSLTAILVAGVSEAVACFHHEQWTVRGGSLSGLLEEGKDTTILSGYYVCHDPAPGDIVAYRYLGNPAPIIKVVKGRPGDKFRVENGRLFINNKPATTSKGAPYSFDERAMTTLSLYEHAYKGIIPADSYLILGNLPSGTVDSSRFGLVHKSDIIGKVLVTTRY